MKNIAILFVFTLCFIVISHAALAESWDDNLIITVPESHDIMTGEYSEVECLALAIYFEARGEPRLGQELIAQLVVNRMASFQYEDTACGVVRQPYQFSWTFDGKSDKPTDIAAYERSYKIALAYLYMNTVAPVPYASEILNVHAKYDAYNRPVNPNWTDRREVKRVGQQVFYVRA